MSAEQNHTATLVFETRRLFSTDTLGDLLTRAMDAMGETDHGIPAVTFTGIAITTDRLSARLDVDPAAQGTRLVLSLGGTDQSDASVQANLAGLVHHLSYALPVCRIGWLDSGTLLPRDGFLEALCPQLDSQHNVTRIALRRPARPRVSAPRPGARSYRDALGRMLQPAQHVPRPQSANKNAAISPDRIDAHVQAYNAKMRRCPLRNADRTDLDAARAEQGAAPVMVSNIARGEDMRLASLAMGRAGLFLPRDTSGAMTGAGSALCSRTRAGKPAFAAGQIAARLGADQF